MTTRRALMRAVQLFSDVRASVVGVVLNDIDLASADYRYFNYGFGRERGQELYDDVNEKLPMMAGGVPTVDQDERCTRLIGRAGTSQRRSRISCKSKATIMSRVQTIACGAIRGLSGRYLTACFFCQCGSSECHVCAGRARGLGARLKSTRSGRATCFPFQFPNPGIRR